MAEKLYPSSPAKTATRVVESYIAGEAIAIIHKTIFFTKGAYYGLRHG
jgi:hypothetical protein